MCFVFNIIQMHWTWPNTHICAHTHTHRHESTQQHCDIAFSSFVFFFRFCFEFQTEQNKKEKNKKCSGIWYLTINFDVSGCKHYFWCSHVVHCEFLFKSIWDSYSFHSIKSSMIGYLDFLCARAQQNEWNEWNECSGWMCLFLKVFSFIFPHIRSSILFSVTFISLHCFRSARKHTDLIVNDYQITLPRMNIRHDS